MVDLWVQEYWNTPVSVTIPVYMHSAISLVIFSLPIKSATSSHVELASSSTTVTSAPIALFLWSLESLYWLGCKALRHEPIEHLTQWECYESADANIPPADALRAIINYLKSNNLTAFKASTGIMICPGYRYRIVNTIITNFHQPQSTLLLLVSAAIGDKWKEIYEYAMEHEFRFLSYGDSCYLEI